MKPRGVAVKIKVPKRSGTQLWVERNVHISLYEAVLVVASDSFTILRPELEMNC
jgi:hypothetical protein